MKKNLLFAIASSVSLFLLPSMGTAQEDVPQDAEGCKDSKLLTRMVGCVIADCDAKEFDSMELRVGPMGDDDFKRGDQGPARGSGGRRGR